MGLIEPTHVYEVRKLTPPKETSKYKTFVSLLQRVVKRTQTIDLVPFPGQDYTSISFDIYRYGPFTLCSLSYTYGECKVDSCTGECGKCTYIGYGAAHKSSRDPEHEEAGINIAFTRAATEAFKKLAVKNKR